MNPPMTLVIYILTGAALGGLMLLSDSFVKMGQNGKIYATENFSKEVCVSKLESMLRKVA